MDKRHINILVDTSVYTKPIWVSSHAVKQARRRGIAYPDHVYNVLTTGTMMHVGKNHIKFIKRSSKGSIVCIGVDEGHSIIIKTVERGN